MITKKKYNHLKAKLDNSEAQRSRLTVRGDLSLVVEGTCIN